MMDRNFLWKYLVGAAAVIVVIVAFALHYGDENAGTGQPSSSSTTTGASATSTGTTASTTAENPTCTEDADYFVINANPSSGFPGVYIIAKHKTSPAETIACDAQSAPGDFVLQNDLPQYFLALTENFLVIDGGTGPPPRAITVYDLNTQKLIYSGTYSSPFSAASGTLTYWEPTDQQPTAANCPNLAEYTSDGLGAVVETEVVFDLSALKKQQLGEYRCEATQ